MAIIMNTNFLMNTNLFHGLTSEETTNILKCLLSEEKEYKKGSYIYRNGDSVHKIGLLLSGQLSIEYDDIWGNKTLLNLIAPGNVFLENYACVPGEPLMVNVVASQNSTILFLDVSHLLEPCNNHCVFHNKLIRNLLTIAAKKNFNLSRRSFHTTPKTIRGRLLSYLSYEASRNGSYSFDIPFNRQQLADYLNLDRSALSNELSKMVRDKILIVDHSHFEIQKDSLEVLYL